MLIIIPVTFTKLVLCFDVPRNEAMILLYPFTFLSAIIVIIITFLYFLAD